MQRIRQNPKPLSTPAITYVGHATVLIEMDGVRILTDPLLRNQIWHLRRRKMQIDQAWYQNIDAVLISHMHWDHLDLPSLEVLGKTKRLIVPQGMGAMLQRRDFQQVEELTVGKAVSIGSVTIEATKAKHDGARFRYGPVADCLGFIITGSYIVYFPGDTDIFPGMSDLTDNLDVALLPVWGWGPTLGPGHMDPYRAALALQLLRPRLAIPIHWGTFFPFGLKWLMPHLLVNPPQSFANFAQNLAPEVNIQIISPGTLIQLDENL